MKTFYTYILLCSDGSFYTGMTNDLDRRLFEHNKGVNKECYTFKRRPLELKWYHESKRPIQAIRLEKQIKGWSKRKKIALIEGKLQYLVELSKNYSQYGNPDERKGSSTGSD